MLSQPITGLSGEGSDLPILLSLFNANIDDLLADYDAIHFDFYAKEISGLALDNIKAPFSHDATATPKPATMPLLGSGLIGLAGFRRKYKKSKFIFLQ
jgi:hypothetical protein